VPGGAHATERGALRRRRAGAASALWSARTSHLTKAWLESPPGATWARGTTSWRAGVPRTESSPIWLVMLSTRMRAIRIDSSQQDNERHESSFCMTEGSPRSE